MSCNIAPPHEPALSTPGCCEKATWEGCRLVPCVHPTYHDVPASTTAPHYCLQMVEELADENTIGVVAILGNTYTGE